MNLVKTLGVLDAIREHGISKVVESVSDIDAISITETFGTHNYHPLPVNIVRAKGAYAYDGSGKAFIDCIGCYSAVAHGHLSDFISDAVRQQLEKLTLVSRAVYSSEMALLLQALCEYTETDMACPMNTGAEAVETAIKLARKWGYTVKNIPEGAAEIIVARDNFHGRTVTIVGFSSESQYRAGFGPFTPGFKIVDFGDIESLRAAITSNTAAVLLEPIQAEGGIIIPREGYLEEVRALCDETQTLLIWDEIQTGFCRTGRKFAWQHEAAPPDLMCLGKAMGGGIFPVSAVVGRRSVMEVFKPGDHGSTFGGNPLGSVVALAAMAELESRQLDKNAEEMGVRMMEGFSNLKSDAIVDVRGKGLLVGLEVAHSIDSTKLSEAFIRNGILTKETRQRTFRFAPPLIIGEQLVDEIVERTKVAISEVS